MVLPVKTRATVIALGVVDTLAELFAVLLSGVEAGKEAVVLYDPVAFTVAIIFNVATAEGSKSPILHTPVVELYAPTETVELE